MRDEIQTFVSTQTLHKYEESFFFLKSFDAYLSLEKVLN